MEEWFYTDKSMTQQGPVNEQTLLDLNVSGAINADSLVWKEGQEKWAPFFQAATPLFGQTEEGSPVEIGVCAHSRRVYPLQEMVPYGDALIGIEHKDAFVQSLMESGETSVQDASDAPHVYVGFWWRVLGSILDYLVKLIPTYVGFIPYTIAAVMTPPDALNNPTMDNFPVAIAVTYGFGILFMLALSIFYDTWMVGKYGATVGKMVIGARVVNADRSPVTYKKAFFRWLVKKPLNYLIVMVPATIVMSLIMGVGFATLIEGDSAALGVSAILGSMLAASFVAVLCCGIYWMCAFDLEKRTMHDRICATRVIKKTA